MRPQEEVGPRSKCEVGPSANENTHQGGTNAGHAKGTIIVAVEGTGRNDGGGR